MKYKFLILNLIGLLYTQNLYAATSGTCGENCSWTFNQQTGEMLISGSGMIEVFHDDSYANIPWFSQKDQITSLIIQGQTKDEKGNIINTGITNIGLKAFHSATALSSVSIPDTVTKIDYDAFYGATALENISLPESVTYIGADAFGSTNLTELILPDSVTTLERWPFPSTLQNLFIPDSVTSIQENTFARIGGSATIYCPEKSLCAEKDLAHLYTYKKDSDGVYVLTNGNGTPLEDENHQPYYFSCPENMMLGLSAACDDYNTCKTDAADYKQTKAEAMAGGSLCATKDDCLNLMDVAATNSNCSTIASCHAWLNRREMNTDGSFSIYQNGEFVGYKGKRIYTIDEANKVTGAKNRVSIKYR